MDYGLNDKAVRDFGEGIPFLPWGPARYRVLLTCIAYRTASGGNAWSIKFFVLESNREDVQTGDERVMWLPCYPAEKATMSAQKLRMILAAASDVNPANPDFDANGAADKFRGLGDDLASQEIILDIVASDRVTKKGVTVTNYHFSRVKA